MYLSKKFCAQETNNIANAHKSFFVIVMSKLPMAFTGLTQAPFLASLYLNQNAKVIFLRSLLKLTCNSNDKSIQRYIRLVQKVFQRAKVIANAGFYSLPKIMGKTGRFIYEYDGLRLI